MQTYAPSSATGGGSFAVCMCAYTAVCLHVCSERYSCKYSTCNDIFVCEGMCAFVYMWEIDRIANMCFCVWALSSASNIWHSQTAVSFNQSVSDDWSLNWANKFPHRVPQSPAHGHFGYIEASISTHHSPSFYPLLFLTTPLLLFPLCILLLCCYNMCLEKLPP